MVGPYGTEINQKHFDAIGNHFQEWKDFYTTTGGNKTISVLRGPNFDGK